MKKSFFLALFFLALRVHALEEFDDKYALRITRCDGYVRPPSIDDYADPDAWRGTVFIFFENGLYGIKEWRVKQESKAIELSKTSYSGSVNIVGHFGLIQTGGSSAISISLRLDKRHPFGLMPLICTIAETRETNPHWLFEKHTYRYVMALSDGTTWRTKGMTSPWKTPWQIGSRMLKIGNSRSPCLINVDASLMKRWGEVDSQDVELVE